MLEMKAMEVRPFRGTLDVPEVVCSGRFLSPETEVMLMSLYTESDRKEVAFVHIPDRQCLTYGNFASCVIDKHQTRRSELKTLVTDLPQGGTRQYGCRLTVVRDRRKMDEIVSEPVTAWRNRTTTTVAPTTTTTTTTTIKPQPRSESPVASGVKSNVQEFQLPISVVIIGLVLLLFFAILCAILVILQCRGKRRRRSRAANRESLLSAKNEPMGEGGYRTPRNIPSYPPGHMPPETPGGNFAMRYQKSIPDTGYVSGSSVYYSEPYGTLDEEMKERLRPNPRMCHIPYDIKGGPLDTSHPQEHSA
ncbi:uncharacterized protein LOC143291754 isoform X13 [Babylonia areolata]|uniref:uncharacterized protein LOC143291754 isoform X13 n=1 Tax=Babylonia areolata TaxID=304850 RepID=UPI003FD5631B